MERIAEYRLLDNYFMRKCFENNIACIELILQLIIKPGLDWSLLPDTYIIFITEHDIWGQGLPLYHICRRLKETDECCGDGINLLYFNTSCQDDTPLGRLAHDFHCRNPNDMYYPILADRVRYFKESKEGIMEIYEEADYWRNEGRQETLHSIVRCLLNEQVAIDKILQYTGLTRQELEELQKPILT